MARLRDGFVGDDDGRCIGDELPAAKNWNEDLEMRFKPNTSHIRPNKGVVIPNALPAVMLPGVRIGVPAADGVPAKNSGFAGGALGTDCSPVSSSIATSAGSEDGKSSAGGDDIVVGYRGVTDASRNVTR